MAARTTGSADGTSSPAPEWGGATGADATATRVFTLLQSVRPSDNLRLADAFIYSRRGGEYNDVVRASELHSFLKGQGSSIELSAVRSLFSHVSHGNSVDMMSLHRFRSEFVARDSGSVYESGGSSRGLSPQQPAGGSSSTPNGDGGVAPSPYQRATAPTNGTGAGAPAPAPAAPQAPGAGAGSGATATPTRPTLPRQPSVRGTPKAGVALPAGPPTPQRVDNPPPPPPPSDGGSSVPLHTRDESGGSTITSVHRVTSSLTEVRTHRGPSPASSSGAAPQPRSEAGSVGSAARVVDVWPADLERIGRQPSDGDTEDEHGANVGFRVLTPGQWEAVGGDRRGYSAPGKRTTGGMRRPQSYTDVRPTTQRPPMHGRSNTTRNLNLGAGSVASGGGDSFGEAATPRALESFYKDRLMEEELRNARLEAAALGDDGLEEGSDSDGAQYRKNYAAANDRTRDLAHGFIHDALAKVVVRRMQRDMTQLAVSRAFRQWELVTVDEKERLAEQRELATRDENTTLMRTDSELRDRITQLERGLGSAQHKHALDEAAHRDMDDQLHKLQEQVNKDAIVKEAYKERVRDLEEQLAASKRLHAGLAAQVDGLKHANDMDDASLEQLKHVVADVKRKQANEVGDASDRAARLRERVAELEQELLAARASNAALRAQVEALRRNANDAAVRGAELEDELAGAQARAAELDVTREATRAENARLVAQVAELQRNLAASEARAAELTRAAEAATQASDALQGRVDALVEQLVEAEAAREQVPTLRVHVQELQAALDETRANAAAVAKEAERRKRALEDADAHTQRLREEVADVKRLADEARAAREGGDAAVEALRRKVAEVENAAKAQAAAADRVNEAKVKELQTEVQRTEANVAKLKKQLKELRAASSRTSTGYEEQLAALRARIATLERQLELAQREGTRLRGDLDDARAARDRAAAEAAAPQEVERLRKRVAELEQAAADAAEPEPEPAPGGAGKGAGAGAGAGAGSGTGAGADGKDGLMVVRDRGCWDVCWWALLIAFICCLLLIILFIVLVSVEQGCFCWDPRLVRTRWRLQN